MRPHPEETDVIWYSTTIVKKSNRPDCYYLVLFDCVKKERNEKEKKRKKVRLRMYGKKGGSGVDR